MDGANVANRAAREENRDQEFAFLASWESTKSALAANYTMCEPAISDHVVSIIKT